jgi:hypothetical protein
MDPQYGPPFWTPILDLQYGRTSNMDPQYGPSFWTLNSSIVQKVRQKGSNDPIAEYCIMAEVRKKFEKKFEKYLK